MAVARVSPLSGDLADDLTHRFWDVVVVTAANASQAKVAVAQLDALHARGQLPGDRGRHRRRGPRGPRVGSGGATHVMLHLQSMVDLHVWSANHLLLHAGGYSERSPAHGTWANFGQPPMDAANVGFLRRYSRRSWCITSSFPASYPGIFVVGGRGVAVCAIPRLSEEETRRAAAGLLARTREQHSTGTGHGVFACDKGKPAALIQRQCAAASATGGGTGAGAGQGGSGEGGTGRSRGEQS